MEFVESSLRELHSLSVNNWLDLPFSHGFLDADLDVKKGTGRWHSLFSDGPKLLIPVQMHARDICEFKPGVTRVPEVDGWLVSIDDLSRENVALGIMTGDCCPVIVYAQDIRMLSVLHCGWRSALAGILPKALQRLIELGARPGALELAIGPAAQVCCYEVSADLAEKFEDEIKTFDPEASCVQEKDGLLYLNVSGFLSAQALKEGLSESSVLCSKKCTIEDKKYFSYRRQKNLSGRQLSFVGPPL